VQSRNQEPWLNGNCNGEETIHNSAASRDAWRRPGRIALDGRAASESVPHVVAQQLLVLLASSCLRVFRSAGRGHYPWPGRNNHLADSPLCRSAPGLAQTNSYRNADWDGVLGGFLFPTKALGTKLKRCRKLLATKPNRNLVVWRSHGRCERTNRRASESPARARWREDKLKLNVPPLLVGNGGAKQKQQAAALRTRDCVSE
jgi:hypothetical protein